MHPAARAALLVTAVARTATTAAADDPAPPTWADVPVLVAAAVQPVDAALRACLTRPLPRTIGFVAARGRDGATVVSMPMPGLGGRGPTREERCLAAAVARISLPALPAIIERVSLAYTVGGGGGAADPHAAAWRDPAAVLTAAIDTHRAALAACDRRPRTVRLVVDRRRTTRVWLPAWQFHAKTGDGTTPPRERKVKACLARATRGWHLPPLPRALGELHVAVPIAP